MGKRIQIVLKPEQSALQDTINEKIKDVQHLHDRSGGVNHVLTVPLSAVSILDELGISYQMPERKKPGPKTVQTGPRKEVHLKLSPEMFAYIEQHETRGYQAFIEECIRLHMRQNGFSDE